MDKKQEIAKQVVKEVTDSVKNDPTVKRLAKDIAKAIIPNIDKEIWIGNYNFHIRINTDREGSK